MEFTNLTKLLKFLDKKRSDKKKATFPYRLPSTWISLAEIDSFDFHNREQLRSVEIKRPYDFYYDRIGEILAAAAENCSNPDFPENISGAWTERAVIYNLFPRLATAWDHDGNGEIGNDKKSDVTLNHFGMRETGTFLKCILLLPLIKALGCNTIHLLPITSVGIAGRKGELGSVYAIRNPYQTDEYLADPIIDGSKLDADEQLGAFIEACHALGLKVVMEFILRTASIDSDWIPEHPDWFYWQKYDEEFRKPELYQPDGRYHIVDSRGQYLDWKTFASRAEWLKWFDNMDMFKGYIKSLNYALDHLIPIRQTDPAYLDRFTPPPEPATIQKLQNQYIGQLADGSKVRVAPAFADDPFDFDQPAWQDVTFLKLYQAKPGEPCPFDLNHIGYDTSKYLYVNAQEEQGKLAQFRNRELWDKILGIIPYYQQRYRINGVMLDMGHALPLALKEQMIRSAREQDPKFAFWDENLDGISGYRGFSQGYDALNGNFFVYAEDYQKGFQEFLTSLSGKVFAGKMFGTPESHNTKRSAALVSTYLSRDFNRLLWTLASMLPPLAPSIHNGFELCEKMPVNTGLGFKLHESQLFRENLPKNLKNKVLAAPKLGLFSKAELNWLNPENIIPEIRALMQLRNASEIRHFLDNHNIFYPYNVYNPHLLAFIIVPPAEIGLGRNLIIAVNLDLYKSQTGELFHEPRKFYLAPEIFDSKSNGVVRKFSLAPAKAMITLV
jgi:hypothetical protein